MFSAVSALVPVWAHFHHPNAPTAAGPRPLSPSSPCRRGGPEALRPGRGRGRCATPRSPALDNGAGLQEKGNLSRRRRRRGAEPSRCARRLRAGTAGPAKQHRPGAGGRARSERSSGAQSPPAWPTRGAAEGAPREGPRSRAGCRMKSRRRCRDPAMAVSVPELRLPGDVREPLLRERVGEAENAGARGAGSEGAAAAVCLAKLGAGVAEG